MEADWPDAYRANRWVRGLSKDRGPEAALEDFTRFPRWMWRNSEVVAFLRWRRAAPWTGRSCSPSCALAGGELRRKHRRRRGAHRRRRCARNVKAPTLLIVGGADDVVIELNREAMRHMRCAVELQIIPGATHLFEERGALGQVAKLAAAWCRSYL